jgi:hypothetical protein
VLLAQLGLALLLAGLVVAEGGAQLAIAGVALLAGAGGARRRQLARRLRALRGGRARGLERALQRLERRGWLVLERDLVAGPGGVFALHVGGRRIRERDLERARARAARTAARLRRPVTPVLSVGNRGLHPREVTGVWCVGASRLPRFLDHRGGPPADLAAVAAALAGGENAVGSVASPGGDPVRATDGNLRHGAGSRPGSRC